MEIIASCGQLLLLMVILFFGEGSCNNNTTVALTGPSTALRTAMLDKCNIRAGITSPLEFEQGVVQVTLQLSLDHFVNVDSVEEVMSIFAAIVTIWTVECVGQVANEMGINPMAQIFLDPNTVGQYWYSIPLEATC